jgi:branched-chain amino acid transport system substrate-binding protein
MKSNKGVHLLGVLVLGALLLGSSAQAQESIRVGVLGLRSGLSAGAGRAYQEGIAVALQIINGEQGGVLGKNLEVIFEDTGAQPTKAVDALAKLITRDGVVMTVGESHSSSALAVAEAANQYKHPLIIVDAAADDITAKGFPYVFRAGPCNSAEMDDGLLDFVKESGFKRVAIVAESSDFGRGAGKLAEDGLKRLAIETLSVGTERTAADYRPDLERLQRFGPDLILTFIYGPAVYSFGAQAHAAGLIPQNALLLDGAGQPGQWSQLGQNAGVAADALVFVARNPPLVDFNEVSGKFRDGYRSLFGREPTNVRSRSMFDALLVAADALRRADGSACDQLAAALEQTDLEVAGGTVRFGRETGSFRYHQWQPPVLIAQWQAGGPKVVYPKAVATSAVRR